MIELSDEEVRNAYTESDTAVIIRIWKMSKEMPSDHKEHLAREGKKVRLKLCNLSCY